MSGRLTPGALQAIRANAELSIDELQAGDNYYDANIMRETLQAVESLTAERDAQAAVIEKVRELHHPVTREYRPITDVVRLPSTKTVVRTHCVCRAYPKCEVLEALGEQP